MQSLRTIWTFATIDIKRSFRDLVAVFFIFIFPLIFLFVFGGIFGKSNETNFRVVVLNNANNSFTKSFIKEMKKEKFLEIKNDIKTLNDAKEKMKRGELDAVIRLPKGFGEVKAPQQFPSGQAEVLYSQNNETSGQTLASILDGVFKGINQGITGAPTPFTVKAISTKEKGLSQFDYVFSGLLGFSILSLGIFGPTSVFPRMKQNGILRRYHTTTLKVWQYFTANAISQMFVGVLSVALMFVVALSIFKLNMRGDYLSLLFVVLLGTATMFGIGLAVGGWAKNENQAAPLANLVSFPMMFLSGTFFPKFLMPEWLQTVASILPLTPINDALRLIVTEGKTLFELQNELLIIGAWFIAIYLIAFKAFRWE